MWPECPSSYLHDKRTMHYSCIKTQYKLHLIKSFSLWNNAVSAVEAAKNLELRLSMDVLKRNVKIYMKHCALHRTGYWLNGNLQYNSSFNHLDWKKKKKDKVALNGNKTQFNHENSFHIETKIEFKIRLLVEIKNIHIYIYTHTRFKRVQVPRTPLQHMQTFLVLRVFLGWEFCNDALQLPLRFTLGEVTHLVVLRGNFHQPRTGSK